MLRYARISLFLFATGLVVLFPIISFAAENNGRLERQVDLDALETPLHQVLEFLSEQTGTQLQVDQRALNDAGIAVDVPVSFQGRGLKLRSVLGLILRDLDLTWVQQGEILLITTPEEAEMELTTVVLDVADLVKPFPDAEESQYDYDSLIGLLTSTIAMDSWDTVGGPGSVVAFRGSLTISQPRDVIGQIEDVLTAIREARKIAEVDPSAVPPRVSIDPAAERANESAILGALEQKGDYDFVETPLEDVISFLRDRLKINIRVDTVALEDVGIGTDVPITRRVSNVSADQLLNLVLKELDLTWMILHESLLITTPEVAECCLLTRAYPVADLLGSSSKPDLFGERRRSADMDQLMNMVTSLVSPSTWDDVGGPGAAEAIPHIDVLVVAQTQEVHEQVVALMAKLRDHLAKSELPDPGDGQGPSSKTKLLIYHVPSAQQQSRTEAAAPIGQTVPADGGGMGGMGGGFVPGTTPVTNMAVIPEEQLLALIIDLVEPASWERDDVSFRCVPGRLLIQQTDDAHRQIQKLLLRLGIPMSVPSTGMGSIDRCFGTGMGGGMGGAGTPAPGGGGGFF